MLYDDSWTNQEDCDAISESIFSFRIQWYFFATGCAPVFHSEEWSSNRTRGRCCRRVASNNASRGTTLATGITVLRITWHLSFATKYDERLPSARNRPAPNLLIQLACYHKSLLGIQWYFWNSSIYISDIHMSIYDTCNNQPEVS
jgi:hypothetical protein